MRLRTAHSQAKQITLSIYNYLNLMALSGRLHFTLALCHIFFNVNTYLEQQNIMTSFSFQLRPLYALGTALISKCSSFSHVSTRWCYLF